MMFGIDIKNGFKSTKPSVVAIGFKVTQGALNILGTGFCVGRDNDNRLIMSVSHLIKEVPLDKVGDLVAGVLIRTDEFGMDYYAWLPIEEIKHDYDYDIATFHFKKVPAQIVSQIEQTVGKFDFNDNKFLPPLILGNSDKTEVGTDVYFLGFPYAGQLVNDGFGLTLVLNKGVVSNIKNDGLRNNHPKNFIIVDAVSNPGNSGSPLIDTDSNKVIGVMSIAFRMQSKTQPNLDIREPMHFCAAKPINLAKELLKQGV